VSPLNEPTTKDIETIETSFIAASEVHNKDTPSRIFLKHGIRKLSSDITIKNKKLKSLQQVIRRQNKKIANLTTIIEDLKKRNLINEDISFFFFWNHLVSIKIL